MLRIRRNQFGTGYLIDNGKKSLFVGEADVEDRGSTISSDWFGIQNEPLDKILNVEVGGEYELEDIPGKNGTVIMSMNAAASGWVVLTYNFCRWNFGVEEYHPENLKCKWKVLSL